MVFKRMVISMFFLISVFAKFSIKLFCENYLRRTTLIQYLLLYKVIYFCCFVFWVLFGRGVVVMCLLCFMCFASALFYVYACM